jgi:2-aminoadipate transaminase
MKRRGVICKKEQVFLTAGAQQGMSLLAHLLLNPGSQVIIEEVIYTGLQQAIQPFQPDILTVPTDPETGMDVDAVDRLLSDGARPSFIYAIPDGHNPLAVNMSLQKRARLVELARRYRTPIIEDDAYGFLCYKGVPVPPMRALDEQFVLYIGTFSKILAPALRVGWMIVPESFVSRLSIIKEASDIDTSTFTQRTISAYIDTGQLNCRIEMLCREYAARRDAMLCALQKYFPDRARWTEPTSGLFIWIELQGSIDTGELLKAAIESQRVAFIPGGALSVCGNRSNNCMRLNFSNCTPAQIEEGVRRLGQLLKDVHAGTLTL